MAEGILIELNLTEVVVVLFQLIKSSEEIDRNITLYNENIPN